MTSLLLADADAEGFHFAIEVAALEAEEFGGVAYVVAGFFNLLEDVFALVGVAGLLEAWRTLLWSGCRLCG